MYATTNAISPRALTAVSREKALMGDGRKMSTLPATSLKWLTNEPSISCVHVKPRSEFLGIDWASFDSEYELAMQERFNCFNKEMRQLDLRQRFQAMAPVQQHRQP